MRLESHDLKAEIRQLARDAIAINKTIRIGPWQLYATPEGYLAAMNMNTLEEVILAITSTPAGVAAEELEQEI